VQFPENLNMQVIDVQIIFGSHFLQILKAGTIAIWNDGIKIGKIV